MIDVSGDWDTDFGMLTLEMHGNKITGEYGDSEGEVEGVCGGNVITGKWWQLCADGLGSTFGDFKLIVDNNGESFTGTWRSSNANAPESGGWNGTRA